MAFYSYLCDHAHSGNLSVFQWRQARSANIKRSLMNATVGLVIIATANMIKDYCIVFKKSEEYLEQNIHDKKIVDF